MSVADLIKLLRSIDQLFTLETKHGKAIEKLADDINRLNDRVTRLEAREEMTIVEARAAAGVAATSVAIATVSDVSRRIGRLEERTGQKRLDTPE